MLDKKKFLIENLKCSNDDCSSRETSPGKICQICNLRVLGNTLCFENFNYTDIEQNNEETKINFSGWKKYNFQKVNEVLKLKKNLNVLDVGSGRHFIENIFPGLRESNFFRLDLLNRNYVDVIADLQKDSYFKSCFDAAICLNVLEHVYYFKEFLKNLSKLLKKNGVLMLSVPYSSGLHYLPHDYFRMSHYALKKLLHDNDFEIKTLEAYYQDNMSKILGIFKNLNSDGFFSKILEKLITLQIRIYNKLFKLKIDNKLVDEVPSGQRRLYSQPMGYFVIAVKK